MVEPALRAQYLTFQEASSPYAPLASQGSMNDVSQLYSSPSMPNISLGRPHVPSGSSKDGLQMSTQTEAEMRAAYAARFGMPLTGQMLQGSLPFYPTLPGMLIFFLINQGIYILCCQLLTMTTATPHRPVTFRSKCRRWSRHNNKVLSLLCTTTLYQSQILR
jgi:hypothetical protein